MKRKFLAITLSSLLIFSLTACTNSSKELKDNKNDENIIESMESVETNDDTKSNETSKDNSNSEETTTQEEKQNRVVKNRDHEDVGKVAYQDENFVLFEDGTNTFTDTLEGYTKTGIVPDNFYNPKYLLNHDFSYMPETRYVAKTTYIDYYSLTNIENTTELEYQVGGYKVRTIAPRYLFSSSYDSTIVEDYNYSDDGILKIVNLIEQKDKNAAFYLNYFEQDKSNIAKYTSKIKEKDIKYIVSYLKNIATCYDATEYEIKEDGNFIIYTLKYVTLNEELQNQTKGKLLGAITMAIDTNSGATLIQFYGVDETNFNIENPSNFEINTAINYLNNNFRITKN